MRTWFPDADLLTVPVEALPDGLVNEALRKLLTEVGVPDAVTDAVELDPDIVDRIPTVDEVYRSDDEVPPRGAGQLFRLGFAGEPFLCVDGVSGALVQVHQDFGMRPLASSLETFLTLIGGLCVEYERARARGGVGPELVEHLQAHVIDELRTMDPDVSPTADVAWRALVDDLAGAME